MIDGTVIRTGLAAKVIGNTAETVRGELRAQRWSLGEAAGMTSRDHKEQPVAEERRGVLPSRDVVLDDVGEAPEEAFPRAIRLIERSPWTMHLDDFDRAFR